MDPTVGNSPSAQREIRIRVATHQQRSVEVVAHFREAPGVGRRHRDPTEIVASTPRTQAQRRLGRRRRLGGVAAQYGVHSEDGERIGRDSCTPQALSCHRLSRPASELPE